MVDSMYRDFVLKIERLPASDRLQVSARSEFGDPESEIEMLWTDLELMSTSLAQHAAEGMPRAAMASQVASDLGKELFRLLPDAIRNDYALLRERARGLGQGTRIKLDIRDPGVALLPWELLHDGDDFLVGSRWTPIVRWPNHETVVDALTDRKLRILLVVADPEDMPVPKAMAERSRMLAAVADQPAVSIHDLAASTTCVTLDSVRTALQQSLARGEPYHVLHFIGHGDYDQHSNQGYLLFENDQGLSERVSSGQIEWIVGDHPLRLVVLNACESAQMDDATGLHGVATSLAASGMPAVIAMQFAISGSAAAEFASAFYGAVIDGLPVEACVAEGRKAIRGTLGEVSIEWATPVLFTHYGDGRLLDVSPPKRRPRRTGPVARIGNEGARRRPSEQVAVAVIGAAAVIAAAWIGNRPPGGPEQLPGDLTSSVAGMATSSLPVATASGVSPDVTLPFRPASDEEYLIVVSELYPSTEELHVPTIVEEALDQAMADLSPATAARVRVERFEPPLVTASRVADIARQTQARLVIWGSASANNASVKFNRFIRDKQIQDARYFNDIVAPSQYLVDLNLGASEAAEWFLQLTIAEMLSARVEELKLQPPMAETMDLVAEFNSQAITAVLAAIETGSKLTHEVNLYPLYILLGNAQMGAGEPLKAIEAYTNAIGVNDMGLDALYNRATALTQLNRIDEALADLERVRSVDSQNAMASNLKGNIMLMRAAESESEGERNGFFDAAIAAYTHAIEATPSSDTMSQLWLLSNRADAHTRRGDYDASQSDLEQILGPKHDCEPLDTSTSHTSANELCALAATNLASMFVDFLGTNLNEATELAALAAHKTSEDDVKAEALSVLGWGKHLLGDDKTACEVLNDALPLWPDHPRIGPRLKELLASGSCE